MNETGLAERLRERARHWAVGDKFSEATAALCDEAADFIESALASIVPGAVSPEVRVKPLEWREDHGVAGLGPYRLFEAETPLGRFSYGTDATGECWWCGQHMGIFTVGDEATAKRQAEAAWNKTALAEANKFVALSSLQPAPASREGE